MSTSRRDFLATSVAAACGLVLGRPGLARSARVQQGVFEPIRRNVGAFTMRGGTIGYLVDPQAVLVVDSQFPAEAAACLEGLNARSGGRPVDVLINTHHHGDHTGGNVAFRGVARRVLAHEKAAEHMRQPPGGQPPAEALYPDSTFSDVWAADAGDERYVARYYGRAHTSGDAVITFERANVVHLGDLVFSRRHPVVDRAAGATIRNWVAVLERVVREHARDTVYIFGHAAAGRPVTGDRKEVERFRGYLEALLAFVQSRIGAGSSREQILALRDPLKGFEEFGPFGQPGPRDPLTCAYEELTAPGE